ncbi:Fc.00g106160.m01.CDS01 [Cosmosporella sp. VM-42]
MRAPFSRCALLIVALFAASSVGKTKDEVHLQWTLCDSHPRAVLEKLNISGHDPYKESPITYYDTYPPIYAEHGLGFRTKTRQHKPISLIKIRHPEEILVVPSAADCVWDTYGHKTSFTCAIQSQLQGRSLWSHEQIQFVERYHHIDWESLVAYGPHPNAKWKMNLAGFRAVFDDVAAGSLHLMEIEVKVARSDGDSAYHTISQYLRDIGVELCHHQEPKTTRLFRTLSYRLGDDEY